MDQWLNWCSSRDLAQKKIWYTSAVAAYDRARPTYAEDIISRSIELAGLSPGARLLEIGCGPGTATVSYARHGYKLLALESNGAMAQQARTNCRAYPQVEVCTTTFEEWSLADDRFDAVLAATSFNWVCPDLGYERVAQAMHEDGALILLWNTAMQPAAEDWPLLREVYERHASSLAYRETRTQQEASLHKFGERLTATGWFGKLVYERYDREVVYSVDDYLLLLSTYSPYIKLSKPEREALFAGLRSTVVDSLGGQIRLAYISAIQVARKRER